MSETSAESGRRATLAVLAGGNFVQLGTRILISPVVPLVLLEFDTTKSSIGLALSGMWAIYALLQFPSGVLADRFGERRLVLGGLAGTAVGAGLLALAPTLWVFGLFALALGAGAGLFFAPASSLVSRLYDEQGGPLGALTAAGAVAGVVFPAVGSFVAVRTDWRIAMGLGAVAVVPILLATLRFVPGLDASNPNRTLRAAADLERVLDLLTRPSVAYTMLVAVLTSFTLQGLTSFLPTFLVEYRSMDAGTAGLVFAGIYALSSLSQPVGGRISDRLSRDAAIALSVTICASGLATLLGVGGRVGLGVGAALLGVGLSWMGPMQARFIDQFTSTDRGYGFGLVRTVYMLIAAWGSVVAGTLAERGGWILAFGTLLGLLVAALVVLGANRALSLDL